MFSQLLWPWLWAVILLLNIVGAFRAYRRADRLTLRQTIWATVGAVFVVTAYRLPAVSTALTGIGFTCVAVSALDVLWFGRGRAA